MIINLNGASLTFSGLNLSPSRSLREREGTGRRNDFSYILKVKMGHIGSGSYRVDEKNYVECIVSYQSVYKMSQ